MKTVRLFDENPYQFEFVAEVSSRKKKDSQFHVVLNQTCFYPEGGGQPSDKGTLNNQPVLDVYEKEDVIYHVVEKEIENSVTGSVDQVRRFDHMQQHSGQHVLSRSIYELYQGETIGFHLGESISTIDINLKNLSDEQLSKIEGVSNHKILENKPFVTHHLTPEEAKRLPLRKEPLDKDKLRIVEVDGFDWSACCGTHCKNSGEIGLIKVIKTEKYKGGIRLSFLCGQRALQDYQTKHQILKDVCQQLSISESDLSNKIQSWQKEKKETSKKMKDLLQKTASLEAEVLLSQAEKVGKYQMIFKVDPLWTKDILSLLTRKCIEQPSTLVFFGSQSIPPAMMIACSKDLDLNLKTILAPIMEEQGLKGGGRPDWMQFMGQNDTDIVSLLESAKSLVLTSHSIQ